MSIEQDSGSIVRPIVHSRRLFLRRSTTLALAGGAAAAMLGSLTTSSARGDIKPGSTKGPKSEEEYFRSIQGHEQAHVAFLVKALGSAARPKPEFHRLGQSNFADFVYVAQDLENTGVGAYLGALPSIKSSAYIGAAGSIALIEARHAGFINTYLGDPITANVLDNETADNDFEMPLTIDEVVSGAGYFIKNLNGGPALTFSADPSDDNDIAILNFALALEYLENEFYNINVESFYGKK